MASCMLGVVVSAIAFDESEMLGVFGVFHAAMIIIPLKKAMSPADKFTELDSLFIKSGACFPRKYSAPEVEEYKE